MATVAEVYRDTATRFVGLGRALSAADEATPAPGCAGWTVHDVIAHCAGLTTDVLAGNVDGLATPPWTAAQVDARRDHALERILDEWEANLPAFVELLTVSNSPPAAIDVTTHEQDVRGALGLVGARDGLGVTFVAEMAAGFAQRRMAKAGLPAVRFGRHAPRDDADLEVDVSDFELGRGVLGRRSRAQLEAWPWSAPPPAELFELLTLFSPSILDVVE